MYAFTVLLFACLALVAHGFPQTGPQIVGGRDSAPGAHPFAASLQLKGRHFCGGSIINKRFILTAAHCLVNYQPSLITVNVGSNYLNQTYASYQADKSIFHPAYHRAMKVNDIGLIRVNKDITFDSRVKPIPIADMYHVPAGQAVLAIGWGRLVAYGKSPNALQEVDLNVYDQQRCKLQFKIIQPSHICTFTTVGKGVCNGDSGGPLVLNGELIGVVSFGRPCAIGSPDVYTRAYSFRDWIKQNAVY